MNSFKKLTNIVGWAVFAISFIVYYLSAERTGSLWDCGEFVAGAYKLQVVHPPGAALFLLVGRILTIAADIFSDNVEDIAFSVNLLSGLCSALAAMFICWVTIILGKLALLGREKEADQAETIALMGAGAVAGLATAFSTSIWFSAVEGEVYAMSTFFTTLTLWSGIKWYSLPDEPKHDRWLVFSLYSAGLSIGVHLLSILILPAIALFYYFKKYENPTVKGMAIAGFIGTVFMVIIQKVIIVGIPTLWMYLEFFTVNSLGLPFHSGIYPLVLLITGILVFGLSYSHKTNNALLQKLLVVAVLLVIGFSTIGVVVIRANANTPINMNNPSDPARLLPYLNREQYGERPLLKGPHYKTQVTNTNSEDRYGQVLVKEGDELVQRYEIVDQKNDYEFNPKDQMLFPRLTHMDENRKRLYPVWLGHNRKPSMGDNIGFFWNYQIRHMYWRYFMWNFSGRQNGQQGFYSWEPASGHWITGISFIDKMLLFDQSELTDAMANDQARNKYYLLPFIFGLIGLIFHYKRRKDDFLGLLALFIITGIGIIVYSNQPPNEPRERDYVLVGSFFTYCIWMGMAVLAIFDFARKRKFLAANIAAPAALALVMVAPLLMGFQNFDDHTRADHKASRDYASNFLNSCEKNAIIFTYGDNDTYPLWYAQEVEGIRTDVRVVNLSLIAVDWYIDQLRRKVNDSPAIKMSLPAEKIRGKKRIQIPIDVGGRAKGPVPLSAALKYLAEDHPVPLQGGRELESSFPAKTVFIPVRKDRAKALGMITEADSNKVADRIQFTLNKGTFMMKGDAAVLDIINSNLWDRPIYFAVTCRQESMLGIQDYTQLEGLALRIVPVKSSGEQLYGMIGNGRVDMDRFFDNVTNKFRWGNFDKKKLFVNSSYGPTIQTTRYGILRAATAMVRGGEKEKAVQLVDTYFEAFPDFNFSYDTRTVLFVNLYLQAGEYDKAKKHIRILAEEVRQRLDFYSSLDPSMLEGNGQFASEAREYANANAELNRILEQIQDEAFSNEIKGLLE